MTVMITGHRQIVPANLKGSPWPEYNPVIKEHHQCVIQLLINLCQSLKQDYGHREFISGMAIGADQLFAEAIIELQRRDPQIRLNLAIPFEGQESKWPAHSQTNYHNILHETRGTKHIISAGGYTPWKMQVRNKWMVDCSDIVIALWDGKQSGGTYNCICYAIKKRKYIIHIHPESLITIWDQKIT